MDVAVDEARGDEFAPTVDDLGPIRDVHAPAGTDRADAVARQDDRSIREGRTSISVDDRGADDRDGALRDQGRGRDQSEGEQDGDGTERDVPRHGRSSFAATRR